MHRHRRRDTIRPDSKPRRPQRNRTMSDLQEILDKAAALGRAIGQHTRMLAFVAGRKGVEADAAAQALLQDYSVRAGAMQQAEQEGRPIEPDEKRAMADAQTKMAGNEAIRQFMRAQVDYIEMMER